MKMGKDLEEGGVSPALTKSDLGKAKVASSGSCYISPVSNHVPCEYNLMLL
jgi:hypothetical protein